MHFRRIVSFSVFVLALAIALAFALRTDVGESPCALASSAADAGATALPTIAFGDAPLVDGTSFLPLRAAIRIRPTEGRLTVRMDLSVSPGDGEFVLPLALEPVKDHAPSIRATAAGRPCVVRASETSVAIDCGRRDAATTVVLEYERGLDAGGMAKNPRETVVLQNEDRWLPVRKHQRVPMSIAIVHPAEMVFVAPGDLSRSDCGSVAVTTIGSRASGPFAVAGDSEWRTAQIEQSGIDIRLLMSPRTDPADFARDQEIVRRTTERMSALAPFPVSPLRVCEIDDPDFGVGFAARFLGPIFLSWSGEAIDQRVFAHEMAHAWFGGATTWGRRYGVDWPDDDRSVPWWESLAEFVAVRQALPTDSARSMREEWRITYRELAEDEEDEDLALGDDTARRSRGVQALEYDKGPLLLSEAEVRIGTDRMTTVLRRFIAEQDGKAATWRTLADTFGEVAGPAAAAWLDARIDLPNAPRLSLADVVASDGFVEGAIVQHDGTASGTIELGFWNAPPHARSGGDADLVGVVPVSYEGPRTRFREPIPAGAVSLSLDPDARALWRSAGDTEVALKTRRTQ